MDQTQFAVISDKLDKVLKLLAYSTLKEIPKEQEKVGFMDSIGFRPNEIDRLLKKNPGYSSVVLSQIRKREVKPMVEQPASEKTSPFKEIRTLEEQNG